MMNDVVLLPHPLFTGGLMYKSVVKYLRGTDYVPLILLIGAIFIGSLLYLDSTGSVSEAKTDEIEHWLSEAKVGDIIFAKSERGQCLISIEEQRLGGQDKFRAKFYMGKCVYPFDSDFVEYQTVVRLVGDGGTLNVIRKEKAPAFFAGLDALAKELARP